MVLSDSRSVRGLLTVLTLALLTAACQPAWNQTAAMTKSGLTVSWPVANEPDADQEVSGYVVSIDGVPASIVVAPTTSCTLVGLTGSTTYTVDVTAYDTAGEWSGTITQGNRKARLTTQVTTPPLPPPTVARGCTSGLADTDGDRLPNVVETDTGQYLSPLSTGTDPNLADTDEDALADGDEVLGSTAGLDLPRLGVSPVRANILLEYDWFDDSLDCPSHSHRPTAAAIDRFTTAFANGLTLNPDGSSGVEVINDYGQGGPFTGGNLVPDANGVIAGGVNGTEFKSIKNANFTANRHGYFHYVLLPHRYNNTSTSSGQAELPGDDLVVSLYCANSDNNVANTIMHELGHNLDLRHGGNVDVNYKPNYNSVMNYRYQFAGVDTDCTVPGNGVLDFSRGFRNTLVETWLDEGFGICNNVPVDWNGNGIIETGVAFDVNDDGLLTSMTDVNDWASIVYGGVGDADGARAEAPQIVTEQPVPAEFGG